MHAQRIVRSHRSPHFCQRPHSDFSLTRICAHDSHPNTKAVQQAILVMRICKSLHASPITRILGRFMVKGSVIYRVGSKPGRDSSRKPGNGRKTCFAKTPKNTATWGRQSCAAFFVTIIREKQKCIARNTKIRLCPNKTQ